MPRTPPPRRRRPAGPPPGLAARRAALAALARVEDDAAWSTQAVAAAVDGLADVRDRRLASHLAYDTLRWHGTLDWMLAQVLDRPLDKVEPAVLRILRLGALQLWRMRVPDRAAVATAVALAREAVPAGQARAVAGFVNGVLRGLARRLPDLPWPDADTDPVAHLALTTGHPAWIVEERLAHLGPAEARALLEADNEPPGVTLRANGDRAALIAELADAGIEATPTLLAPEGVRAPGADPRRLAAVTEGRAVPQDEASLLVVHATAVQPGDRVLDLCAGPGGKTTHLAHLAGPGGHVTAVELHEHRARRVLQAAAAQGLDVEVVVGDARDVTVGEAPDVVLVDGPCTGLGVGRRRPEVRWRRRPEDVTALAALQVELALRGIELVRAGGRVTYAVCTWTVAETVDVVETVEAMARRPLVREGLRQLLPSSDGTDGMFHVTWTVAAD